MALYSTEGIKVWMYTGYVRRLFIENLMQKVLVSYLGVFKSLRPSQPDGSRCLIQTTPEEVVLRICDYLLTERDGSHAPLTYSMTEFQPTICAMSRVQRAWNYAVIPKLYKEITINSPHSNSCLVRTLEDPKCKALVKLIMSCIVVQSSRIHRSGCAGYNREEEDNIRRIYKACPNLRSMVLTNTDLDSCRTCDYVSHLGSLSALPIGSRSILPYLTRLEIVFNVTKPCVNNQLFSVSLVLPTLQDLRINGCTGSWTQCRKVLQLPTMPQLRRLAIINWMAWATTIALEDSPKLRILEFLGGTCLNIDGLLVGFIHVAPSIEVLSLTCKVILHQSMFRYLRRFTGVTTLCIPITILPNVITNLSWSTLQFLTLVSLRDNSTEEDEMRRAADCIQARLQDEMWRSQLHALQRVHICAASLENWRSSIIWTKTKEYALASRIKFTVCYTNSMRKGEFRSFTIKYTKPKG